MDHEAKAFFITIMADLDSREQMWESFATCHPARKAEAQPHLMTVSNIKTLTLGRAREFGLVVNDDARMQEETESDGVTDMDAYRESLKHPACKLISLGEY